MILTSKMFLSPIVVILFISLTSNKIGHDNTNKARQMQELSMHVHIDLNTLCNQYVTKYLKNFVHPCNHWVRMIAICYSIGSAISQLVRVHLARRRFRRCLSLFLKNINQFVQQKIQKLVCILQPVDVQRRNYCSETLVTTARMQAFSFTNRLPKMTRTVK